MQPLLNHLCSFLDRILQSAFPDDSYAPAKSMEHLHMALVAINVSLEFLPPEILIGPGDGCIAAAPVSVPEATVNKYHCPVFGEHKVGGTRQLSRMKSISQPSGKKKGAKCPFRPSVLSTNARHHATALRSCRDAHGLEGISFGCLQKQQPRSSAKQSEPMRAVPEAMFGSLACS